MKWYVWLLLAIGTALACQYAQTLAAVILLIAFIGIIAVMWVRFYASIIDDEAAEKAERMAEEQYQAMLENTEYHVVFKSYIGLGKGYEGSENNETV